MTRKELDNIILNKIHNMKKNNKEPEWLIVDFNTFHYIQKEYKPYEGIYIIKEMINLDVSDPIDIMYGLKISLVDTNINVIEVK